MSAQEKATALLSHLDYPAWVQFRSGQSLYSDLAKSTLGGSDMDKLSGFDPDSPHLTLFVDGEPYSITCSALPSIDAAIFRLNKCS